MDILWVIEINSKATSKPKIVIVSAAVFMYVGIVVGGVFSGMVFSEMISPAIMLPMARRVIGLMTVGLFSFSNIVEGYRGCPVCTNVIIRKL